MGAAENRDLVRRWIIDGWNANNTAAVIPEVYSENWIDGDSTQGPHGHEGVRTFVEAYLGAFPDFRIKILQMVADDEYVALRWRGDGTNTGSLYGRPASMKPVSITGHALHRMVGGKIGESWIQVDLAGLFSQIGSD